MTVYVTQLEGALNIVQQEYPMVLSVSEVQKHLRDHLFHGCHKQLHNFMHFLYVDMRIMDPQLVIGNNKAKPEQEGQPGYGIQVRSAQSEGKDGIVSLREQIVQL